MNQEKQRNEILTKLDTIKKMSMDKVWNAWLDQVIEFIKENS